jgi:nicotinate-nucleotide pyrophosphorylase (carboxylating)
MTKEFESYLNNFINNAILEDRGNGDHSTLACIPRGQKGRARLIAKEEGIVAGVEVAEFLFKKLDPESKFDLLIKDGEKVEPNDIVFKVECETHDLLVAERLCLNIMQRMSGIATNTNQYVKKIDGLKTKILDTRKTAPGMRLLDKAAVKTGGGENHRIGLFDMIMLKDNHIDFAGGLEQAINKTREYLKEKKLNLKIEVEARDMNELKEILNIGGIDRIMLDNFTYEETRAAVKLIDGKYETESSGMINLDTVRGYAECGVDYISIGSITHRVKSLDLSLKAY